MTSLRTSRAEAKGARLRSVTALQLFISSGSLARGSGSVQTRPNDCRTPLQVCREWQSRGSAVEVADDKEHREVCFRVALRCELPLILLHFGETIAARRRQLTRNESASEGGTTSWFCNKETKC